MMQQSMPFQPPRTLYKAQQRLQDSTRSLTLAAQGYTRLLTQYWVTAPLRRRNALNDSAARRPKSNSLPSYYSNILRTESKDSYISTD